MKPHFGFAGLLFLVCTLAFSGQVNTQEQATKLALDAIQKFQLTTLKGDCGVVDVVEKETYFEFLVRERHSRDCGGSAESGPRLFSVRVRKRDGQLTSDVYDGVYFKQVDRKPESSR